MEDTQPGNEKLQQARTDALKSQRKCSQCDFVAKDSDELADHILAKHPKAKDAGEQEPPVKEDATSPEVKSEIEIGDNNTVILPQAAPANDIPSIATTDASPLTSPSFTDGADEDKVAALNTWTSLVSSIRQMKSSISSKDNLLNIIQCLKNELGCIEADLTKIVKPSDAATIPYQKSPTQAIPTPSLSIADTIDHSYDSMTTAESMQRLAGLWPKSKLIESKKKIYITFESWENARRKVWPNAIRSTAFSPAIRYICNEEYVAEYNMRQKNGYIKINPVEEQDDDEINLHEGIDISKIELDSINPEQKDHDRAEGLKFKGSTFHGNNSPWASEASKMAKLIKDPLKLIRRAKAVALMYGTTKHDQYGGRAGSPEHTEVWAPFADALERMKFTREQIMKISASKKAK